MKTHNLSKILFSFFLVIMTGCTTEELHNNETITTLRASIEQPYTTKTALSEPSSGLYKTLWVENDKIAVYANGSLTGSEFSLTNGAGTNNGEFMGTIPSGNRIAVYPYSICGEASGNTIKVILPEEQQYKSGNIPDNAYPMVATSKESTLQFKNLCSVLKVSMTGSLTVNSILFSANNTDVKVSGNATIDATNNTLTMSSDAGSKLVLTCGEIKLSNIATDFYIVVPSQNYRDGFSIIINTDNGRVLKTIKSDVNLKRSELYRITPFECTIDESNKNIIFDDASFKAYMIVNFDKDADGEISFEEAQSISSITVCTDTIASIAGLEYMTNLTYLKCNGTRVWNNTTNKYDGKGLLKSLDITKNTKLTTIYCSFNKLLSLNVTNNMYLRVLHCDGNLLKSIDINKCSMLTNFKANDNFLTSIDFGNNKKLTFINVNNNQINTINVSSNTMLNELQCEDNNLTSIDISNNTKLKYLLTSGNKLTKLDVSNNKQLLGLYCSNNTISSIDVTENSLLVYLICNNNNISLIDLHNNPDIRDLTCYQNTLSELDLSKNSKLTNLDFKSNSITTIDLQYCPDLKYLDCSNNSLNSLKVNGCPQITYLSAYNNNIAVLDISKLSALIRLDCQKNPLKTLYIYEGQMNVITTKYIPTTTNIVVGSEPGEDEVFTVTPTSFDLDGKEQDITMTVTASMDYSLDSKPEWISPKSAESGTYVFTVAANETTSSRNGDIVFKNTGNAILTVTVKQGIQAYTSSDYSQDGKVTKLLSATVGNGIDVVFVGDAFADKDQELFNKYVELGTEAFFTEEPFKSAKNRFNIYRIGSVSKNGIITQEGGDTKFSAEFGQGTTYIEGDNNLVNSFVRASLPSVDLTKTIIFVIINKAKYAGTCHMYSNNQAICYVPLCSNETEYAQTLRHEGCGHGFGKLADEYFYTTNGRIPEEEISQLRQWQSFAYGFYENVDLTNDPNTVLWSKFISDSRYSGIVGIYEGGYTYPYGVYRPTENSIMRYNTGGFNAPSREAIYKKIMNFSEGEAWSFDYETFVEFDAPARSAAAATMATTQSATVDKTGFIPLAPPVMIIVEK